jgi:ADP-ribose pyrophosphatase YjhB (NUDIX family)
MLFSFAGIIWKKMPKGMRRWLTRRFQTSFTVSAAGIITNDKGEVLLLDHVLRPVSGWGLPGGFMDIGEQPEVALRRELREETGIELTDVRFVTVRTLHAHMEIIFKAIGVGEPLVKTREITNLGWFSLDGMPAEMSQDQQLLILKVLRPDDSKKETG